MFIEVDLVAALTVMMRRGKKLKPCDFHLKTYVESMKPKGVGKLNVTLKGLKFVEWCVAGLCMHICRCSPESHIA